MPTASPRDWLVRLRWGAVLGQGAAVGFAAYSLPSQGTLVWPLALIGLTLVSNLALARTAHPAAVPGAVVLDLVTLTALLILTGGASNPFSALYMLQVALAAVLLGPRWTWGVALGAIAGFALQFPFTDPHAMHRADAGGIATHLWGMWVGFAVTAVGIAWFVARLSATVRARDAEVERLRREAERRDRVLSLATLAAGTAHELGSPLGAIAVAAREVEVLTDDAEVREEARAIRAQVDRCRDIVARLTNRAGAPQAEASSTFDITTVLIPLHAALPPRDAARVDWPTAALTVHAPPRALTEALGSLLQNALLAGPGRVHLDVAAAPPSTATAAAPELRFTVQDQGVGIPADTLGRIGDPFFTTRPAGEGMGLGVFLARRFAEGLGGGVEITSTPGVGTTATLTLPAPA